MVAVPALRATRHTDPGGQIDPCSDRAKSEDPHCSEAFGRDRGKAAEAVSQTGAHRDGRHVMVTAKAKACCCDGRPAHYLKDRDAVALLANYQNLEVAVRERLWAKSGARTCERAG